MPGWIFVGLGIFAASGAYFDWDWFMNNSKARLWVTLFGRRGARIFYALLGLALMGLGVAATSGVIHIGQS